LEWLDKAGKKGVAIYEWDQFLSRLVGDEWRYANKVAVTSNAVKEGGNAMAYATANLNEHSYRDGQVRTVVSGIQAIGQSAAKKAIEHLVKVEADIWKWMRGDLQDSFMVAWVKGVVRANLVPFFKDEKTLIFDFEEEDFIRDVGKKMMAKKMWRKNIETQMRAQGRDIVELDRLLAARGARWSIYNTVDHKGEYFIIGSSNRPLHYATTARECYNKAGEVLRELLQPQKFKDYNDEQMERVLRLRDVHAAIAMNGWNRFSPLWWIGNTPSGTSPLQALVRGLQDAKLIDASDEQYLRKYINSRAQSPDTRFFAFFPPAKEYRPLGGIRDGQIGLPDPRWMKADDMKTSYEVFSAGGGGSH
jgi:hypothetical protein